MTTSYKRSELADAAEHDLKVVRRIASEMNLGALPPAWQHVYNLLIELERAYSRGKYDGLADAKERAAIAALPATP